MTVHLVKLSVGSDALADLEGWVKVRVKANKKAGLGALHDHVTRMFPRRKEALLDGGSLYWVIKGLILARQPIRDLRPVTGADGVERCAIMLDPTLVPTEAQPRKAFQGWRYLEPSAAPADISAQRPGDAPPALRAELAALGLL